jgi:hypothetical protein
MPTIVTPPSVIKVQVGTGTNPKATSISYGAGRTLKGASDLNMSGAQDNDVIVYQSSTDSFIVDRPGTGLQLDNGFF